jgi:hypothetical protein
MGKSTGRRLSAGDWVEVRGKEEILQTLDRAGQLNGMPFMPEMLAYCGKCFQVYKRAHKTCDTVFPVRGRRVERAIHLETRCDGSAHGGCQAGCLLFWREEWLKPISPSGRHSSDSHRTALAPKCTEADVLAHTQTIDPADGEAVYSCQATRLPYFTQPLEWWDIRQYLEDYWSGNVNLWRIFGSGLYALYYRLTRIGFGGPTLCRIYDRIQSLWGGIPYPDRNGRVPDGEPTPAGVLNLQPGELVRVKAYDTVLRTLNMASKNRGLYWGSEMVPYCGKTFRVLKRITRIINERTGKMQAMKGPCIVLDSVVCQSRYSHCRLFCPRSIYSYWREIWLERVNRVPSGAGFEDQVKDAGHPFLHAISPAMQSRESTEL